jgi:hypothetical protein
MALGNDSVTVTPGAGATIATQLAGGKEHQVMMLANSRGHIDGSAAAFTCYSGQVAAAASKPYMHVFNATGSGVVLVLRKLFIQPNMAVTALAAQQWSVRRTSALGTTGAVAVTPVKHSTLDANLSASVTVQHSYTAGGTVAATFFDMFVSVEETFPGVHMAPFYNILPTDGPRIGDYEIQPGEGISLVNVTGGVATYGAVAVFTVE